MGTVLTTLIAFAMGALPTGAIAGRIAGVDLRAHGSGNIGATNAFRILGPRFGVPVLIIDIAKGVIPVLLIAPAVAGASPLGPTGVRALAAVAAVAGHIWSPFVRFRGGKGVATAAGAFVALSPLGTLAAVAVWAVLAATTRYFSVGSLGAAVVLPFAVWYETRLRDTPQSWIPVAAAALLTLIIFIRHRSNISRLRQGRENRFAKPGRGG